MTDDGLVQDGLKTDGCRLGQLVTPQAEGAFGEGVALPNAIAASRVSSQSLASVLEEQFSKFDIAILRETPAFHLLNTFGLLEPSDNSPVELLGTKTGPHRTQVVSIRVHHSVNWEQIPTRGLEVLPYTMVGGPNFDLVFSNSGMLKGIVAIPEKTPTARADILQKGNLVPDGAHQVFLNLCPFYHRIPQPDEANARESWKNLAGVVLEESRALNSHVTNAWREYQGQEIALALPAPPWVSVEADAQNGNRQGFSFAPADLASGWVKLFGFAMKEHSLSRQFDPNPGAHRAIFPRFPTVFAPRLSSPDEVAFHAACYSTSMPKDNNNALVIGPGIGVECWLMAKRGVSVDVVGINPLEVANVRASAQATGFECRTAVGSNIVDHNGNPHLSGIENYGAVVWNMPWVCEPLNSSKNVRISPIATLGRFWDGDEDCQALYKLARNLAGFIHPEGTGIFWNHKGIEGHPTVREILESAGDLSATKKLFSVQEIQYSDLPVRVFKLRPSPANPL